MSMKPIQRIAYVKLSQQGKSYPMQCNREDLGVGDSVEVVMHVNTGNEHFNEGIITSIAYKRWDCSCRVVNHQDEVSYSIMPGKEFIPIRTVNLSNRTNKTVTLFEEDDESYLESQSSRSDMKEIYESIAQGDNEDAYLGDGVWLKPNGCTVDRGR